MSPDPFRVTFLTITLDSQAVLAVLGLVVAGLMLRLAARRDGLELRASDWWDIVTAAVIGGRLLWVATHLDYYLHGPLQVVVIVDGGLDPIGLVLGAAYAIRGLRKRAPAAPLATLLGPVAVAVVAAFIFERAGCSLTTCGAGPLTDLPWALRRGDEWRQPLALYQLVVLAVALLMMTELRQLTRSTFAIALVAVGLNELIALALGGRSWEALLALVVAALLYWFAARRDVAHPERIPSRILPARLSTVSKLRIGPGPISEERPQR